MCRSPEEAHIRALLLQSTGNGHLSLRQLDSTFHSLIQSLIFHQIIHIPSQHVMILSIERAIFFLGDSDRFSRSLKVNLFEMRLPSFEIEIVNRKKGTGSLW